MQLLVILAMLLLGKDGDILKQAEPLLRDFGGEDINKILKQAQEITQLVSALQPAGGIFGGAAKDKGGRQTCEGETLCPLAPVAAIADKDITYCMTRYFSEED